MVVVLSMIFRSADKESRIGWVGADGMLNREPHDRLEAALRTASFFSGDALNFLCMAV